MGVAQPAGGDGAMPGGINFEDFVDEGNDNGNGDVADNIGNAVGAQVEGDEVAGEVAGDESDEEDEEEDDENHDAPVSLLLTTASPSQSSRAMLRNRLTYLFCLFRFSPYVSSGA